MRFLILALALAAAVPGHAQSYPSRPVRVVVGFTPGGGVDINARLLAAKLSELLGQQFVVENKPGAGTNIGNEFVAKSAADGYTLLFTSPAVAINMSLYRNPPYDALRDFAGVSVFSESTNLLVVPAALPAQSVKDLVAMAKEKSGTLNYSSAGQGTTQHLAGELFKLRAGVDLLFIPYKGNGPALTDLLGGQLDTAFNTVAITLPLVQSGKLRALAVAGERRSRLAPDVPTMIDAGLPGFAFSGWYGIVAPARTPDAIVKRLNQALVQIMKTPDIVERMAAMGNEPVGNTPAEFDRFIRDEIPKWGKVIRDAKISLAP